MKHKDTIIKVYHQIRRYRPLNFKTFAWQQNCLMTDILGTQESTTAIETFLQISKFAD